MLHKSRRLLRPWVLIAVLSVWSLFFAACMTTQRTVVAPAKIAGAQFVGSKQCAQCHAEVTAGFSTASHAKLAVDGAAADGTGCESCHGAGSLHVKAGGSKGTIINPQKSPETCYQCHLDKRGQFSLPYAHAISSGKMTCTECHEPHKGKAVKGTGASLHTQAESCTECHTAQKGPFIFKHNAMKEGCTACHNPHGSVNNKMLNAPDSNLCLQCHATGSSPGMLFAGGRDHAGNPVNGTCWVAGCHEAVHGSNVSHALRF